MLLSLCCLVLLARASASVEITELHQESSTLNTITLAWSLSPADAQVDFYTLLIDGLINTFYPSSDNTYTVVDLRACTEYDFKLVATVDGVDTEPATTTGSTDYLAPEAVTNLHINEDQFALEWTAPGNEECIDHYAVCLRSAVLLQENCHTASTPSFPLSDAFGCDSLRAIVSAVSGDHQYGPAATLLFNTTYADPGKPRNFEVELMPNFAAKLTWDLPEENAACIIGQSVNYGPYDASGSTRATARSDNEAVVLNLRACTNYLFELFFISVTNVHSEAAYTNVTTDYILPGPVSDVVFQTSTDSVRLVWGDIPQDGCLDYLKICYTEDYIDETECLNVTNPQLDHQILISDLEACRTYKFTFMGVSITGEFGSITTYEVTMDDVAPGPVQNLMTEEVTSSYLRLSFDPPILLPECVAEYVISSKQELLNMLVHTEGAHNTSASGDVSRQPVGTLTLRRPVVAARNSEVHYIFGLSACSYYRVEVYAVSASHQESMRQQLQTKTTDELPGPPTDLRTATSTGTSITITWVAPENRFCVSSYEITYEEATGTQTTVSVPNTDYALAMLHTLSGLEQCTSYIISVASEGELGRSDPVSLTQATQC